MGNESASSTQELGPQFASALYDRLQSLRGKACMSGYGHGEVIYPDIARRIGIAKLSTDADYERELFTERGFTDEDLQSGVTAVMESEFLNHNWPRSSYIQEPRLRYYNISGTGRVIGGRHNELEPTTLEPHHLDAI